jgi:carbonic anhydrase
LFNPGDIRPTGPGFPNRLYVSLNSIVMALTHDAGPGITADEALKRLIEGNRRFLRGQARFPTVQKDILVALAREQRPYATILGCSDSRVPPELLFDASFGELFVIRVAGNTLSAEVAGSMQYAGVHLQTPLFVILGHEGCGAVNAALETHFHGVRHRSRIAKLVKNIVPAIKGLNRKLPPDKLLAQAIEANVRFTMKQILSTPEGKARLKEGKLKLVGAIYELKTGRVRFLRG